MEIRFGESFPLAPPFCRVVYPRFLPFIQGGGGHVTGGGSICMDLLTPDGELGLILPPPVHRLTSSSLPYSAWNPVYSISAVLVSQTAYLIPSAWLTRLSLFPWSSAPNQDGHVQLGAAPGQA